MFMSAMSTVWPKIYDQTLFTFAMFAESRLEGIIIMQLFPFRLRPRQGKVIKEKTHTIQKVVNGKIFNWQIILIIFTHLRVIFKSKMTMGSMLQFALLIMAGLGVVDATTTEDTTTNEIFSTTEGMNTTEQGKLKMRKLLLFRMVISI